MKRIYFKLREESLESQQKVGRDTPCLEFTFKDSSGIHTHQIHAGIHDVVFAFRESGLTLVITYNPSRLFIGIEAFEGRMPRGDVFFQGKAYSKIQVQSQGSIPLMVEYLLGFLPGISVKGKEGKS